MSSAHDGRALPPLVEPADALEPDELDRYSRHILLPEIGATGQRRLKNARVLVIGAGGLGSPVLLHLAAAGVGTLGIVDDDRVEASNLQRQIIHTTADVGRRKVDSARDAIAALNPRVQVDVHPYRLTEHNAVQLIGRYDLVIDGADNFTTRYLVSDAAELAGRPHVWGSILRFAAQVSVFWAAYGPTYRDLYPDVPPPESAPTCGEAGVLGALCGVAGSMMAAEAVKLLTGTGRCLLGRLSIFDLADSTMREIRVAPDPKRAPVTRLLPATPACAVPGPTTIGTLSVSDLRGVIFEQPGALAELDIIDVREPAEFELARIPHARSVPLSGLRRTRVLEGTPVERRLILYCKAGPRAHAAAAILRQAGYAEVRVLDGGIDAWLTALGDEAQVPGGLPCDRREVGT